MIWYLETAAGWITFSIWIIFTFILTRFYRNHRLLSLNNISSKNSELPKVSVIIPARDEEEKIEGCLDSILASDYPFLEVIAVNDRSCDQTASIIDKAAAKDKRLIPVHIETLPEDWLGKSYAMQTGAAKAKGELLLFADGDVNISKSLISLAVDYLTEKNFDHICIVPRQIPGGYPENSLYSYFLMMGLIALVPQKIPTKNRYFAAGIGAFNLLKKSVFSRIGGFEEIKFDIVDDYKLGRLIKRSGFRQNLLHCGSGLRLKWIKGLAGYVNGTEKNFFAALDFSVTKVLFVTGLQLLSHLAPYAGLLLYGDTRVYGFGAAALMMHILLGYSGIKNGFGWSVTFFLPFSAVVMVFSCWRSTVLALLRGGIWWRDTFYPIEKLRENIYR